MRTEIDHQYKWGFFLSEQELRRVAQSAEEHAAKVGTHTGTKITAKLKDGSLIESENLDDILGLENGGQKAVIRLTLQFDDGQEKPDSSIIVRFEDGVANHKSWDSVSVSVIGESRAAVFVAAADLDDRVKKTRTRAWPYLITRPLFMILPLLFGMILVLVTSNFFSPVISAVDQLEQEYTAGRVSNPIEALILLERLKATPSIKRFTTSILIPFLTPWLLFLAIFTLAPKLTYSYVFYWGDAIARYNKRLSLGRTFWVVIILGVIVTVIGGLILRVFP